MNQDVEKLWELQTVLTALSEREKQLNSKPESFAAVDREWQAANAEMEKLQGQIDVLTKERRRVDGELSDQQELLKKYQGQLMQVKNQQQYAAAWKEIDAARKHVKELEASLPERTRREFQRILKQRLGVAVVKVANDSCSACRTRVRPALYQQLKRGELVYCEGCHRILYLEPTQ